MEIAPDLSLCVVRGEAAGQTGRFLRSVYATDDHLSLEVFVLEGKAGKETAVLGRDFPEVIFREREGAAVAGALNTFLLEASGRYLSLWDDGVVVDDNCLLKLVEFLDEVPDAGVAGPKMRDRQGRIQPVARSFPSLFSLLAGGEGVPGRPAPAWGEYAGGEADWFAGPGLTISRLLLEEVGGINEHLSRLWPLELCQRAGRAGWHVHFLHDAQVTGSLSSWQRAVTRNRGGAAGRLAEALHVKLSALLGGFR